MARVNRAIDHVLQNLDGDLRLETVASVAAFSPFHFHRVFQAVTGETLLGFVKRVRMERALRAMVHQPTLPLTEVALMAGFSSSSEFSRSFRKRFGDAPSRFDVATWKAERRDELNVLMERQGYAVKRLATGQNPDDFEVVLRRLPARTVAYLRVVDPYRTGGVPDAAAKLVAWAQERGCAGGQWLGYQWEDPDVVPLEDCRYDVAVEVDAPVVDGAIGCLTFPPMTVAELSIDGGIDLELRALDWLFGTWLPRSGLEPVDQPCFEAWDGLPFAHGTDRFALRLWLPVREG